MVNRKLFVAALFGCCTLASAQNVLVLGHVQRVVLEPSGTEHCPPPCPKVKPARPCEAQTVCVSNAGGCQSMEVKVDHVYLGEVSGDTRQFKSRIGEWGPTFPVTEEPIIISEEGGNIFWSPATERDGKIFIDPKRLRRVNGASAIAAGDGELVALDEVLIRSSSKR